MAETGSDTRSGIGTRLRAGREKMGFTQLQTAEKLHVDAKVVESLESERFDALGAPVFVRGHLRHFAELIGEHPAQLVELYNAATQPVLPDLTKLPKAAPDTKPSRLAVPALVVLIGFVLVGIVWWIAKSVGGSEGAGAKRGPQPVVIAPEITPDPAVLESASDNVPPAANDAGTATRTLPASNGRQREIPATRASGAGASVSQPVTAAAGRGPSGALSASASAAPNGPSAAARTGSANGAAPGATAGAASASRAAPVATAGAASAAANAAVPAAVRGKAMQVTLRFAADSWVEVYDANGAKLFYDVGSAASSHTLSGTPPFRVTVANAPGVSLDVNGKPASVPANAVKGDEAQFVINRAGRIVRAPPKADGG